MLKLKCNPARLPYRGEPTRTVHTVEEINIAPDTMIYFPVGCEADEFKAASIPYTDTEIDKIIGRNTGAVFMKIKKLENEGRI